jgi:predicted dienelactone hydrolase
MAVTAAVLFLVVPASDAAARGARPIPFALPDEIGPFAVGRISFEVVDPERDDRTLPVDVWYPVDPEDAVGPPSEYTLLEFSAESPLALDAPAISDAGRFGLVVFSHGSGGIRFQSFFLTELLASHGFIVIAPDHVGNTLLDAFFGTGDPFLVAAVNRIHDVSLLISHMLERNRDSDDPFHRTIHPFRIGVSGHSFGGFTSIAMAAGFGQVEGLPAEIEPIPPDRRVRAIVPIAPVSSAFSDEELAGIRVPTMIIGGTLDTTTPVEPESARPFELIRRNVYRADLVDAVHFSFSNSCTLIQELIDQGVPPGFVEALLGEDFVEPCGMDVLAVEEAHRITQLYAIAHLRRHLNHDLRYVGFLREGYARFFEPDVIYQAKRGLPLW